MKSINYLTDSEELFFKKYHNNDIERLPLVFIIASPRTGSTLLYQLLINFFNFYYFSNLINDCFAEYPIIGAALDNQINPNDFKSYDSLYGKTGGIFGPSEGSLIFRNWFGDKHPSQTLSAKIIPEKSNHMVQTFLSIHQLTGKPLLIKNAWNCFRIKEFVRLFSNIHFIWLRRDLKSSALSDLEARYKRGSVNVWNSATTANYKEIQKKPYWEQVVEQQYEYNKIIKKDVQQYCKDNYIELWYEDICRYPDKMIEQLTAYFEKRKISVKNKKAPIPYLKIANRHMELSNDLKKIKNYISNDIKYSEFIYR